MKKASANRFAFSRPRTVFLLVLCAVTCLLVTRTLLAFLHPQAPSNVSQRTLTFEERVSYQRAIEEVYWRHRIWPRDRGGRSEPKPPLDVVMPQAQLEKKVADYLRNSQALEDYWQRPITAEQLQAEMDRMAKHTKQPEVLSELFEALDSDPFVIAECLARPALAQRLMEHLGGPDKSASTDFPSKKNEAVHAASIAVTKPASAAYTLPKISIPTGYTEDTWTPTLDVPGTRRANTTIWTGSEMIIWGGSLYGTDLNTGEKYNPATDAWTITSTINAPQGRNDHTAVWTGTEMIVWGG
jgi:hypothetical protein